jgi:hypothetical protein
MNSLPLALPIALLLGCGVVVSPDSGSSDAAQQDSTALDGTPLPDATVAQDARADAVADVRPGDAGPRRPRSIVRVNNNNFSTPTLELRLSPRGPELPTDPPEVASGCWVIAPGVTNLVSAGNVVARWNAESLPLTPDPMAGNEYQARRGLSLAANTMVTVTGSGSDAFPAFSVSCTMPEPMPMITEPMASLDGVWNSSTTLFVRWTPAAGSDLVRVSIGGFSTLTAAPLSIQCVGPITRGVLAIPSEALRLVDAYPMRRALNISRIRVASVTVGDATIDAWCSKYGDVSIQYMR